MNETELIDRIYRTIADPARWSDVLVSAADFLQCTGGMLVYQPRSGGQGMAVLDRLSQELLASPDRGMLKAWALAISHQTDARCVLKP